MKNECSYDETNEWTMILCFATLNIYRIGCLGYLRIATLQYSKLLAATSNTVEKMYDSRMDIQIILYPLSIDFLFGFFRRILILSAPSIYLNPPSSCESNLQPSLSTISPLRVLPIETLFSSPPRLFHFLSDV